MVWYLSYFRFPDTTLARAFCTVWSFFKFPAEVPIQWCCCNSPGVIRRWRIQLYFAVSKSTDLSDMSKGSDVVVWCFADVADMFAQVRVPSPVSLQDFWCSQLAICHIRSLIPWRCSRTECSFVLVPMKRTSDFDGLSRQAIVCEPVEDRTTAFVQDVQWFDNGFWGRCRYKVVCRPQIDGMRRR